MTFLRLLLAGFVLAVLHTGEAWAEDADYRAVLKRVAAMEPHQRQRWLLELESRLDVATRKVLPRQQAAEQRKRVYNLLRQKIVPREQLIGLMRLADQREETARALAARPDPLDLVRKSIIRKDPQAPLPEPTPSTASTSRRGKSGTINGSGKFRADSGESLGSAAPPTRAAAMVPRRLGDSVGDLSARAADKPGRRTIGLTVEADRVPVEPIATDGQSPPRVAARTDVAERQPGDNLQPKRPPTTTVDSAVRPTFTPPKPAEGSPARVADEGVPRATDTAARGTPTARTVLKPSVPPVDIPKPVDADAAGSRAGLPPEAPSSSRKTPAIRVNMNELSARITGTNLALRTLEAELDDREEMTVDEIAPFVERLAKVVSRRNDLALYMDIVSPQQRAMAGRLESSQTVVMQLQSRIDSARTVAAGPDFSGSESDRQAVLWQLDKLSRTLGKL